METQEAFSAEWNCQPAVLSRAPGRVNLIGEHIDYNGYGVLPMAIEQACCIAAAWQPAAQGDTQSKQPTSMRVANVDPGRYPSAAFPQLPEAPLPAGAPAWLNYIHAAYRGCVEFARSQQHPVPEQGDVLLMVGSSIPPAAGLSSSSALVVAAALALLELWGLAATPAQVADFTCRCERFVGTQGGGMDQAVCLLAQAGRAMHVEFNPVRAQPVPLPPGALLVVANSLAPSAKAETASYRFNLRVLECRLAAMLLTYNLAATADAQHQPAQRLGWQQVATLQQVEQQLLQYAAAGGDSSSSTADALAHAVQALLPEQGYTLGQVSELLGVSQEQLLGLLPQALHAAAAAATQLQLQQRACHVFTEAHRVLAFKQVCEATQLQAAVKLQQLGELLNASHASCSQLYQCSCEELDSLVGVARAAGALGARLTGAGWGGCIVALVAEERVAAFMQQLTQQYYQPLVSQGAIAQADIPQCVFASTPSGGATVKRLQQEQPPLQDGAQPAQQPALVA